jgi:Na+/H+ antiporter NhaD/arsenite permease-like protein
MTEKRETKSYVAFLILVTATAVLVTTLGLTPAQIASVVIFSTLIYGTLLFWRFRVAFALIAALALLLFGLTDVQTLLQSAGLDIILFLIGMMIVVGFLEERKFFEYLLEKIVSLVGNDAKKIVIVMMLMAGLFAALVDEVTSILFMTATMLHLIGKRDVSPAPFIMMLVFATNVGSSATVIGNPIGVMIAFQGGLTFADFIRWATPVAVIVLLITIFLSVRYFSSDIKKLGEKITHSANDVQLPKRELAICLAMFLGTITFLIFHQTIEAAFHLKKNTMLLGTSLGAAGVALLIDHQRAREIVDKKVDWWTLTFFLFFFASVGTLKYVGVTNLIANGLFSVMGHNELASISMFTGVAWITTAFMDNVLAVATLIPVVHDLGTAGLHTYPLWWGLLFGGTYGGNLTIIGSTANIVAIGVLERKGHSHITFMQWLKPGLLVSIPGLIIPILMVYFQIPFMPG